MWAPTVDVDEMVEQWRVLRAELQPPEPEDVAPDVVRRPGWWRRLWRA